MNRNNLLMLIFVGIVSAHWAEHIVQAVQYYLLGWPAPHAMGLLGMVSHGTADNEWLHFGYALFMTIGLVILTYTHFNSAKTPVAAIFLWLTTLTLQLWHLVEHTWLLEQFLGGDKPVSFGTSWFGIPRLELHLLYNSVVTAVMLLALLVRWWGTRPYQTTQAAQLALVHGRGWP